jgi:hypothetical protein
MLKKTMILATCVGAIAATGALRAAPPKGHPDSSSWDNLFTPDLSNATFPKGVWSVSEGVLTATEDQCIWTKAKYENFVVDLEFKNASGTNSGVFVYCSSIDDFIPNSVEIQIADDFSERWSKQPKSWHCGAIFGHQGPIKSMVKKPGEWNRMTITCKGPKISVMLNGVMVTQIDMKKWTSAEKNPDGTDIPPWLSKPMAELATVGHVGLQGKHGGVPIYFRNLKIKKLEK